MTSNIQRRAHNAYEALRSFAQFGHLSARQLSRFVWPEATPKSALNMSRVLIAALVKEKHLLARACLDGTPAYVITSKGAAALNLHDGTAWVKTGTTLRVEMAPTSSSSTRDEVMQFLVMSRSLGWQIFGPVGIRHRCEALDHLTAIQFAILDRFDAAMLSPDGQMWGVLVLLRNDDATLERFDELVPLIRIHVIGSYKMKAYYAKRELHVLTKAK